MRSARALAAWVAAVLVSAGAAQAATPELSTTNRLQDRREVAAGQRSYVEGFQDGRFYANGWHSTGEMGGVWAPPLKLVDGVWFGIDDQWVGQATKFSSGWGYTRYDLPDTGGLHAAAHRRRPRRQPRGALRPAADQPGGGRQDRDGQGRRALRADGRLPVGLQRRDAERERQHRRPRRVHRRRRCSSPTTARCPARPSTTTRRSWPPTRTRPRARRRPAAAASAGPQPGHVCAGADDRTSLPSACDDGPFGKGTGGELRYQVTVPAGATKTLWVAVAGSDKGLADAQSELAGALQDPAGALAAKVASRDKLVEVVAGLAARRPAAAERDRLGQAEPGRPHADRLGPADPLDQPGQAVPGRRWGRSPTRAGSARATPTTRGSSPPTASTRTSRPWRSASSTSPRTTCAPCATSPTSSTTARASSSTRRSPTARSGSATTRRRPRPTARRPTTSTPTRRSSSRARSRSSGAGPATTASATRCTTSPSATCRSSTSASTSTTTAGPRARATSSARAWAPRSSTTASTTSARSTTSPTWRAPSTTGAPSRGRRTWRASSRGSSRARGGTPRHQQYADSLMDPGNVQSFQKHWIGQVPMEAELSFGDEVKPGVASHDHGTTALAGRENSCFSGDRPGSRGLFHTGCGGGPEGKGEFSIFSLTTSIQAVGEGNFGRLGPDQQQRYTHANAETMFSEPATGDTPDEQPGAMPEIFPSGLDGDLSTGFTPNITAAGRAGRWSCRPGATTAPYGRSSTSSSGCGRSSTPQSCRWCRRSRRTSPAWRGRTSGSAAARWASSRRTPARATRPRSTRRARRCTSWSSATRCRGAPGPRRCGSTDGASSTTTRA